MGVRIRPSRTKASRAGTWSICPFGLKFAIQLAAAVHRLARIVSSNAGQRAQVLEEGGKIAIEKSFNPARA